MLLSEEWLPTEFRSAFSYKNTCSVLPHSRKFKGQRNHQKFTSSSLVLYGDSEQIHLNGKIKIFFWKSFKYFEYGEPVD